MSVQIIRADKWVTLNKLIIRVTDIHNDIIKFRMYGVMTINGTPMEYDMFEEDADLCIVGKGTLTIMSDDSLKIKQKIMIK